MTEASEPVVVEQAFAVPRETLWNAITEREQMVQWFFDNIPEFRAEVGFETQFDIESGGRNFRHLWKITEAVSPQRIVYDWRYEGMPGVGKVTFELFAEGSGSRLRVTNEGLESFPQDVPEFTRESAQGGWEYLIQGTLRQYLES